MPHEAPGNPNNYEIIWDWHGGGGSAGGTQVVQTPAVIQNAILIVQQYLGTPNAVGGKGIVLAIPNYRLTSQGGIAGTNTYPAQWQDAKCAAWHVLANSATFPGNKTLMGSYGTSWGAVMVR